MTIGTCQTCGSTAPIEWFLAETEYRQMCPVLVELPREVQGVVFRYLSLFRPTSGRAIASSKATRLLGEIRDLVKRGYVRKHGQVDRPCPPRLWALAMEQMVERRERLGLPLPNHRYMVKIAWGLADEADKEAERARGSRSRKPEARNQILTGDASSVGRTISIVLDPMKQWMDGQREDKPTDEEMAEWKREYLR